MFTIKTIGEQVLRNKAKPVRNFDKSLKELIWGMQRVMAEEGGIGLAAPQVGVSKRVVIVQPDPDETPLALVNPLIKVMGDKQTKYNEGCLSIPGVSAEVFRPEKIFVMAVSPEGKPIEFEADGLMARVVQHEVDHLKGVLFIDHLPEAQREDLLAKYEEQEKDTLTS